MSLHTSSLHILKLMHHVKLMRVRKYYRVAVPRIVGGWDLASLLRLQHLKCFLFVSYHSGSCSMVAKGRQGCKLNKHCWRLSDSYKAHGGKTLNPAETSTMKPQVRPCSEPYSKVYCYNLQVHHRPSAHCSAIRCCASSAGYICHSGAC